MKKFLALALALVMALSLAACGKKADDNKGNGDEAKGSVYYLNFKPEADKAWQDLAKTYTEQTGVEVKVVTAASGQYDTMLTSELDKSAPPTMFQVGNQGSRQLLWRFPLSSVNTDVMKEMTTQDFNLKNANGETVSIGYCYEAFGIIVNKALLKQAGYEISDITNFETLKKVADDIHSRAAELALTPSAPPAWRAPPAGASPVTWPICPCSMSSGMTTSPLSPPASRAPIWTTSRTSGICTPLTPPPPALL